MKRIFLAFILTFLSFIFANADECRTMNAWCGFSILFFVTDDMGGSTVARTIPNAIIH